VMSGPLVRSSYRAGRLYRQALQTRQALSIDASVV
jgi:lipoyl synthase